MIEIGNVLLVLVIAYLMGSIPFGFIVVKLINGRDVRQVESGRTGGTNAMRAAGIGAGLLTASLDVLKGAATAWVVSWLVPQQPWVQVGAALLAIIGHNYSIFLVHRKNGKWALRGGAGGATALGGAIALWNPIGFIILPVAFLIYLFIGYASVTTMSIAFIAMVVFIIRAIMGLSPWAYVIYGALALLVLVWALRPNIKRLIEGTERVVGLRAKWLKKKVFNE
ncbi:MAG: glycerol-3-phosphate acyltransferase [Anaerolineaceae bacterium]|nr:glycerol-3-phosphate acyltransferase [Anaerolineaceae bacterium]